MLRWLRAAPWVALLIAGASPGASSPSLDLEDDAATYGFRGAPFNAYGLTRLEELRGKPVLVEFWGTR